MSENANCKCPEIMQTDKTRHFRGCPLREKYPTHEAEQCGGIFRLQKASPIEGSLQCDKCGMWALAGACEGDRHANGPAVREVKSGDRVATEQSHFTVVGPFIWEVLNLHRKRLEEWKALKAHPFASSARFDPEVQGLYALLIDTAERIEKLEDLPRQIIQGETVPHGLRNRIDTVALHAQQLDARLVKVENAPRDCPETFQASRGGEPAHCKYLRDHDGPHESQGGLRWIGPKAKKR
jgi:hypothetical protein